MNHPQPNQQPVIDRFSRCPFNKALCWTLLGWSSVTLILWLTMDRVDADLVNDSLLIALASGAVACLALIPGLLIQFAIPTGEAKSRSLEPWGRLIVALSLGITIRSVGTVALFLTYRYQLASSTEMIAAMVLGWYVFLTSIEVIVLARSLPETVGPSARKVSVPVDTSMPVKV